jgi:hypothetical protein
VTFDLKAFVLGHLIWVVAIAVGLIGLRVYLSEHDARLLADQQAKISEARVESLQAQMETVRTQAAKQVQVIVKQVEAVKTPAQAIAAIPDLSTLPLHSRPAADNPIQVSVDAMPLVQELAQCKVDAINLQACQQTSVLKDQQLAEKDKVIAAIQKPKRFLTRFVGVMKSVGIGVGIGALIGSRIL